MTQLPYRIATLVFLTNEKGELLLLERNKSPNKGHWSPIGGKLDMGCGESPFQCAIRETWEEAGHAIEASDLHLFAMVSEKSYEGSGHWLLFLFTCNKPVEKLPPAMSEGRFKFFSREGINGLQIPETDRKGLWPLYDEFKNSFSVVRADCSPGKEVEIIVEEGLSSVPLGIA